MRKLLLTALFASFLLFGLWFLAIPEELIKARMESSMRRGHLQVEVAGLRKGLFYSFTSPKIPLRKSDRPILFIDDFKGRINPLSLLIGTLSLSIEGTVGGGALEGMIGSWRSDQVDLRLNRSHLEGIPLLGWAGLRGKGILSGALKWKDGVGDLRFSIADVRLEGSFAGFPLPLEWFSEAKGVMAIRGDSIHLAPLSLTGEGIYARVKGDVVKEKLDLLIELMPDPSFVKNRGRLAFLAMDRYRICPGHYQIPVRSSVSF
jgi:type II secretion system protein N